MRLPGWFGMGVALAVVAAITMPASGHSYADLALPHPSPVQRNAKDPAALNASCINCHRDIAAEWNASLHKQAHTDPAYQRALAIEPLGFCRGCHAPEADSSKEPPTNVGAIGVACVTCHVPLGQATLASPVRSGESPKTAPHPVTRLEAFGSNKACASCHEFSFPHGRELMQSTIREQATAPAPAACASCHMPLIQGPKGTHRKHTFEVTKTMIQTAVRVAASQDAQGTVAMTLTPTGVGHAVPTGDLFRRLVVRAEAFNSRGVRVAEEHRYLTRHWRMRRVLSGAVLRLLAEDNRPGASTNDRGAVSLKLALGDLPSGSRIHWSVAYEKVEHPRSESEDDVVVGGAITISEGDL